VSALWLCAHVVAMAVLPVLLLGVINRTKALWAGRKGPPLLQTLFDLARLMRKRPVYSAATTPMFRVAPMVVLASTLVSAFLIPLLGGEAPFAFPYDFVAVAYLWGLGRLFLMLAALDTGSSLEGMGASREATFGALLEPAIFLVFGTLAAATGHASLEDLLRVDLSTADHVVLVGACAVVVFMVLQVEGARVPVDDPNTHLELTMIHEVMILDHSGPELAALQYAAVLKTVLCAALLASLVNPEAPSRGFSVGALQIGLVLATGIAVGCVESLTARLKLRSVPHYIFLAGAAAFVALLSAVWRHGDLG
jgi:formate hydrogenlyase subunit 4